MAENTKIEWCDATWNPWLGCQKVSAGCTNCYAETLMDKRYGKVQWGGNGTRVKTSEANWRKPLAWNKVAEKDGVRRRVFCASLADVFEDWPGEIVNSRSVRIDWCETCKSAAKFLGPGKHCGHGWRPATMDDLRLDLFALIDATPWLDWLLLTKRPENIIRMWHPGPGYFRDNVWLGTSVENQEAADKRHAELLKCLNLSPVLWYSAEPLLEQTYPPLEGIDWLVVGGESGGSARPCDIGWIRDIIAQCADAEVPCFVKQLGSKAEAWRQEDRAREGHGPFFGNGLRDSKGGDPSEWPEDLRVRQFPVADGKAGG